MLSSAVLQKQVDFFKSSFSPPIPPRHYECFVIVIAALSAGLLTSTIMCPMNFWEFGRFVEACHDLTRLIDELVQALVGSSIKHKA